MDTTVEQIFSLHEVTVTTTEDLAAVVVVFNLSAEIDDFEVISPSLLVSLVEEKPVVAVFVLSAELERAPSRIALDLGETSSVVDTD